MSRLKMAQDRHAAVVRSMEKILDVAAREDRELNEQESQAYAAYEVDLAGAKAAVAREQAIQEHIRGLSPAPDLNQEQEKRNRDKEQAKAEEQKKFRSLGEQMVAVAQAAVNGYSGRDPRLVWTAGAAGLNETSPADGGYLVQKEFEPELMRRAVETGVLASRVRRRPIGPNANGLRMNAVSDASRATGSRYGGIQTYWLAEAGTKTPSAPKFRQMELNLKKLIALCYSTDELLQDAVALEGFLNDAIPEEFGFALDDAILNGTGVGMPLGILKSSALVTVAKESGQTNGTIVAANVINMFSRLWPRSIPTAAWFVNMAAMPQLTSMVLPGTTTAAWVPSGNLAAAPGGTLMGLPVVPIEQAEAVGTVGDIMLLDLSQYLMIDRGATLPGGIERASSIHVRFLTDETAFRFVFRCDGQPIWDTALTPYKGSATQSPFVTLAVR
jgi:HK97 family phage major capsid protein